MENPVGGPRRFVASGSGLFRGRRILEFCRASGRELVEIEIALDAGLHFRTGVSATQFGRLFLAIMRHRAARR